ncbi:MAG: amidohydrolase [Pseudomonadales bacterium]|nr:amidohydrolase [Pseudomonadales bacterium]
MFVSIVLAWILTPTSSDIVNVRQTDYLDMHVHTAGLGLHGSEAFINEAMRSSYKFPVYLFALGVSMEEIESQGDVVVLRNISRQVSESRRVARAVVLAMDGVIDGRGELDVDQTQIYVPNSFLMRELPQFGNLAFGASVNPYRIDALERLDQVADGGALLVKWIPNIMLIDPADTSIIPFYRKLVELDLPLLTHTGQERSFAHARDEFGDPERLALPLSLGVRVMAAHIGSTGASEGISNFERLTAMIDQFPSLAVGISSLTQVNRRNTLVDALQRQQLTDRMHYGTDWPLQFFPLVSPLFHLNHISWREARSIVAIDNAWDRDVALKEALGVPSEVFERTSAYFSKRPGPKQQ